MRRVLGGLLVAQLAIGAVLVWRDLSPALPSLLSPPAPQLTQPVSPGDQTRRYRLPARPGTDMPSLGDTPRRLMLTPMPAAGSYALEGRIAANDADRILPSLAQQQVEEVHLNSPGGSVTDALEIGAAIRAAGIATRVADDAVCLSACPYILAAGTDRVVEAGGRVGVHQHYFGQSTVLPAFMAVEDVQRGQGEVMVFLDAMGIDPLLMRHALATPPNEIYILVPDELEAYRLVTQTGD